MAAMPSQVGLKRERPDYLPARMVNEFAYCPRLFFYEWVEGLFAESIDTVGARFITSAWMRRRRRYGMPLS